MTVIASLVGLVFTLSLVLLYYRERTRRDGAEGHAKALKTQFEGFHAETQREQDRLRDAIERREEVIRALKVDIGKLEADVASCRDPAVVRDRLRKVLAGLEGVR